MDPTQQYPPSYLAESVSWELIDVAIAFGVFETVFAILFFVSRYLNRTANGLDFYLMAPAYVLCFCQVIFAILTVNYGGTGNHVVAVSPETLIINLKLETVWDFVYLLSISFPKLAILALYERLFTIRIYRHAVALTALVVVLTSIVGFIVILVTCQPFAYSWNKAIPGGHCGDIEAGYRWINIPSLATDVAILILPLHVVWHLHTGIGNKIGLTLTFLIGCIGLVTSMVRFIVFIKVDLFIDPTYIVKTTIWSIVEPGVYFIAATLPSLRPLLGQLFKNFDFRAFSTRLGSSFSRKRNTDDIALTRTQSASTNVAGCGRTRLDGFEELDGHEDRRSYKNLYNENDPREVHTYRERWEEDETNHLSERIQSFSVR